MEFPQAMPMTFWSMAGSRFWVPVSIIARQAKAISFGIPRYPRTDKSMQSFCTMLINALYQMAESMLVLIASRNMVAPVSEL